MKAVIVAGGVGSRISEETGVKPKPMIDIGLADGFGLRVIEAKRRGLPIACSYTPSVRAIVGRRR